MTEAGTTPSSPAVGSVQHLAPKNIQPNPENPRLIFRQEDLEALEESIASQGILVPLTVYKSRSQYIILDGERRWRCALKLGLPRVPVIIQPEPTRFQNIMMMFAIHNARKDWDPLPTAYKLQDLEREFIQREERRPTEAELAQLASMTRGEVRRLKKLLDLPENYHQDLMDELEKPRSQQVLTVDLVLETTRGVDALVKRDIIKESQADTLRQSIIKKYKTKVITNTVEPRQLARIARAVEREEIPLESARSAAQRLIADPKFGINDAFKSAAQQVDLAHTLEQFIERAEKRLLDYLTEGYPVEGSLREALIRLARTIGRSLNDG